MKIKNFFLAFTLVYLGFAGYAQSSDSQTSQSDTTAIPSLAELRAQVLQSDVQTVNGSISVPTAHRALFCRFDDKLDKKHIPLRMRLGSVEEVNRMEAKPGFRVGQLPN